MDNTALRHTFSALIISVAFAGTAHAGYLCDKPPSPVDRRACEAAWQGPEALRHFMQHIRPIHNLYFFDYVDEARLDAWDASKARAQARPESEKRTTASISTERR
jgi:hypothetical protein